MELTLQFNSQEDLQKQIKQLQKLFNVEDLPPPPHPELPFPKPTLISKLDETVSSVNTKLPTPEEAKAAILKVSDDKGVGVARAIMTELGATRFSDLKPDQYTDLIRLCNQASN